MTSLEIDRLFCRVLKVLGIELTEYRQMYLTKLKSPAIAVLGKEIDSIRSSRKRHAGELFSKIHDCEVFLREELPCIDMFCCYKYNQNALFNRQVGKSAHVFFKYCFQNLFKGCFSLEAVAMRCDLLESA